MAYFVYIMSSTSGVLYVGMTNDLPRRVGEHADGMGSAFTSKYRIQHLIYFEEYQSAPEAIDREKQIKRWRREKKEHLIGLMNPDWKPLNGEVLL